LKASLENLFFVIHVLVNDLSEFLVLSHQVVLIEGFMVCVFHHVLALLPKDIKVFLAIFQVLAKEYRLRDLCLPKQVSFKTDDIDGPVQMVLEF
jgi:hypothetical protein